MEYFNKIILRIVRRFALSAHIILFFIITFSFPAAAGMTNGDSLHFEILLTGRMFSTLQINEKLTGTLDITSNRLILLSTTDQFYLLGQGGLSSFQDKVGGGISSFAFTPDNLLMVIRNNELCTFDTSGRLFSLFRLPDYGMAISAGKYVMYIYNQSVGRKRYAVYTIAKEGRYSKLFEIPSRVGSVAEIDNALLFSSENALYKYFIKTGEIKVLAVLPDRKPIQSIAADTISGRIYFATDDMVCALVDTLAVVISKRFGGVLRNFIDGLIIYNPEKKYLVRMVGIDRMIASAKDFPDPVTVVRHETDTLDNNSILNMVKSRLSDEMIIKIINKSNVNFNTSIESMIYMSNQNVSSDVIRAMKNAMKKKTGGQTQ